jgi:hypothetical protein
MRTPAVDPQHVLCHSSGAHRNSLRQHRPLLAHGRGDVLADDGTQVASYAQEALLRFATCGSQIYCPPTVLEDNQVANECEAGILGARSV